MLKKYWIRIVIITTVTIVVLVISLSLLLRQNAKNKNTERPEVANNTAQFGKMTEMVADIHSDMAKTTEELRGLVRSNQVVTLGLLRNLSTEMVSNNASIRAEIPTIVEKEVTRVMKPYQKLLTMTNSPSQSAKPPVVINNQNITTNYGSSPQPQSPIARTEMSAIVINNQNIMGSSGPGVNPLPPTQPHTPKSSDVWDWWKKQ